MSEDEAEKCLGTPIFSRFSKVIKFDPINIEDKIKIAEKTYTHIFAQLSTEDQELIAENTVLQFFISHLQQGFYQNMRTLKNDIEDALNYEILKARSII